MEERCRTFLCNPCAEKEFVLLSNIENCLGTVNFALLGVWQTIHKDERIHSDCLTVQIPPFVCCQKYDTIVCTNSNHNHGEQEACKRRLCLIIKVISLS